MRSNVYNLSILWFTCLLILLIFSPRQVLSQNPDPDNLSKSTEANLIVAQPKEKSTKSDVGITGKKLDRETTFSFHPIGIVHSPYTPVNRPPRQGRLAPEVSAKIEIDEAFKDGLDGIESCEYIIVLFVFDRSQGWNAKVTPPGARQARGVFATRSPHRPCPIGMTVVRLVKREGRFLHVKGIDAFDQTPVLDIKPYVSSIDSFPDSTKKLEKKLGFK